MASRVNTRFVAFLAVGLMLLGGGVMVAAYFALSKSGADYVAIGDKHMQEANYEKAFEYYGKAVYKKRTNAEWIDKWIKAMEKTTPSPQQKYADRYMREYLPALKAYADALPEDVAAQRRQLDEWYARMRMNPPSTAEEAAGIIVATEEAMKRFPEGSGAARELLRYRAFANIFKLAFLPSDQANALIEPILSDLTAAMEANPADERVVVERAAILMRLAEQKMAAGERGAGEELEGRAKSVLDTYLKAHPGTPGALWAMMKIELVQGARSSTTPTKRQLYEDKHPLFEQMMQALRAQPDGALDVFVLEGFCDEARRSDLIGNVGVLELLYDLQAKNPGNMVVPLIIGQYESLSLHFEKAADAYQKVIDAPQLPLSFDGFALAGRRLTAYKNQLVAKLSYRDFVLDKIQSGNPQAIAGVDAASAEQSLKDAEEIRAKLAEFAGESNVMLKFVDAKLAYAKGDWRPAGTLIDEYNQATFNRDLSAVMLQGEIMERLSNVGAARTAYQSVLSRDPVNLNALLRLSMLEESQQNYAAAAQVLEQAQKLIPNVDYINERLSRLRELQAGSEKSPDKVTDRIVRATMSAQDAVAGLYPDYKRAASILAAEIKFQLELLPGQPAGTNQDVIVLFPMLVQVLSMDGRREEALRVAEDGLLRSPTHPKLKMFRDALKVDDPKQAMLELIEAEEKATPFQKHIQRCLVHIQFKEMDKADEELAAAEKLDPDQAVVTEIRFRRALMREELDIPELRALAERAAQQNVDNVGGLLYKALLEAAEGHIDDAITTLEAAVEKDRTSVEAWRQLGGMRLRRGLPEKAAAAYTTALTIRPQDVESIKGFMRAKQAMGQVDEAVRFARANEKYGVGDMDFVDLWLSLESAASAGDPRAVIAQRRTLAKRFAENPPGNPAIVVRNNVALIRLLISSRQLEEAEKMIGELRASSDDAAYVEMDIRLQVARDNIPESVKIFNTWVVTLPPEKHTEVPYLALSQIYREYGKYNAAIGALRDGRSHAPPESVACEAQLGDLHFALRQWAPAVEAYNEALAKEQKIVPADDAARREQEQLRLQLNAQVIESLVRLERYDEADRVIRGLGAAADGSARVLLLKADILAGKGDFAEAERSYDAAIAADRNDPIGYIKRAEFLARDEKHLRDAQEDLAQALKLNPKHLGARQALANIYLRNKESDKAVEVLREGLLADPENDQLRLDLIGLYLRLNRDRDAIGVVDDVLRQRQEDPLWLFRGREVMYQLKRYNDAAVYAQRLWERKKDAEAALAYVDAAMRMERPDYGKVVQVLGTPELKTDTDLRLLLARARVQLRRDRASEATVDLSKALGMVDQANREEAGLFMSGMSVVYPDPKMRVQALTALRPREGYRAWMAFFFSNLKSAVPETSAEGMAELRAIAESNALVTLRKEAYAVMGGRLRNEGKSEEAMRVWMEGLKLDPADAQLNNNVAYILCEDLGRPNDALEYGERAVRSVANDASIQDTIGVIYMKVGQRDKADAALRRALSLSRRVEESVPVLVHLAQLRLEDSKMDEGCAMLRRARDLLREEPEVSAQYLPKIEALEKKHSCQ
jgi:tetratricopeptide (TPR) repeat protein